MKKQKVQNTGKSCIHLTIVRHGEKEGEELSEEGKEHASSLNLPNTIAYASDITRTQLTAYFSTNPDIKDFEMTLNDFEENSGKFRKIRIDKKLGYNLGKKGSKLYQEANEATINGKYCAFIIDSDKYFQNEDDSTYTKVAGDFAEIVLKYCKIRNYAINKKILPKTPKEFKRLLVSHQGILELIMFKLIEKNERREGLKKFIEENHLEGGVNFCEGIDIYIYEDSIKLKFRKYEYDVSEKFLEDLINERDELYKKANGKK